MGTDSAGSRQRPGQKAAGRQSAVLGDRLKQNTGTAAVTARPDIHDMVAPAAASELTGGGREEAQQDQLAHLRSTTHRRRPHNEEWWGG